MSESTALAPVSATTQAFIDKIVAIVPADKWLDVIDATADIVIASLPLETVVDLLGAVYQKIYEDNHELLITDLADAYTPEELIAFLVKLNIDTSSLTPAETITNDIY